MSRWFYTSELKPNAKLRLFCFPYAGGSVNIFKNWENPLGKDIQLHCIQLPGRGARIAEQPIASITLIVHHLANAILPLLDRPVVFFGHSNGALIAYELAREIERRGNPPISHLIISAKRAAHLPPIAPRAYDLSRDKFIELLRAYEGAPSEVLDDDELMDVLLPAIRADFGLSDLYEYRASKPVNCDLTLLGTLNDRYVPYDDLLSWNGHSSGEVTAHVLPGEHFFVNTHALEVIDRVKKVLNGYLSNPSMRV